MNARRAIDATYAPEGLSRAEAARYVGVSARRFSEMVRRGDVPPPLGQDRWHPSTLSAWLETLRPDFGGYPERPCIYFVAMWTAPYVKIGAAKRVAVRIGELQTGNPEKLYPLALIPGTAQDESAFHRVLASYRVQGEWFNRSSWINLVMDCAADGVTAEATVERLAVEEDAFYQRLLDRLE